MPIRERRAQLIRAAARVISREGVAGATTRRIAEEAGAPLASLHYTFHSKEDLFAAVIDYGVEQTAALISACQIPPGSGLATALGECLAMNRSWAKAEPDMMVAQYSLLIWMLHSASGRRDVAFAYERYAESLTAVLRSAATSHERDANLNALVELAMAVVDGMILQLISVGPKSLGSIRVAAIAEGLILAARRERPKQKPNHART